MTSEHGVENGAGVENSANAARKPSGGARVDVDPRPTPPPPVDESAHAAADPRTAAAAHLRRLFNDSPWAQASERLSLWLVSPPRGLPEVVEAPSEAPAAAWLAIDRGAAQTLGGDARELHASGALSRDVPPGGEGAPAIRLSLFTAEALEALLAGNGRRALEARWSLRHATPLTDRLGRHERLVAEASRIADGELDRALRSAYLAAAGALPALARLAEPGARASEALPAAGEAAAALARVGCLLDEGCHPPLAWLLPTARATRLGRRLTSWLDDLGRAVGGDEAAARRVAAAGDAVLEQTHFLVAHRLGERPWLRDPASFALRPPRS